MSAEIVDLSERKLIDQDELLGKAQGVDWESLLIVGIDTDGQYHRIHSNKESLGDFTLLCEMTKQQFVLEMLGVNYDRREAE